MLSSDVGTYMVEWTCLGSVGRIYPSNVIYVTIWIFEYKYLGRFYAQYYDGDVGTYLHESMIILR